MLGGGGQPEEIHGVKEKDPDVEVDPEDKAKEEETKG